jgi:hypothetical protein
VSSCRASPPPLQFEVKETMNEKPGKSLKKSRMSRESLFKETATMAGWGYKADPFPRKKVVQRGLEKESINQFSNSRARMEDKNLLEIVRF